VTGLLLLRADCWHVDECTFDVGAAKVSDEKGRSEQLRSRSDPNVSAPRFRGVMDASC
jgi:hypothetical protein